MTVTVCATFQLPAVKVSSDVETVPSVRSALVMAMVTSSVGWLLSTTSNVACPPASVVIRPEVGFTTMPAVSSSWLVAETSEGSMPLYAGSVLLAAPVMIVYA